ncbi:LOW QUALITY PROTEIN: nuclear factor related to kappa-B-binding protein [Hyla sarda]|uniref:LOW QUALITY PROTEIN: nuclear factor related to kappa-B-binding protein n=1 Tax=Hyla sarda TaxID=327740 RepID=UPI0024C3188D|nr:LOW QUALITY PROTEIN: nuclear factor related to kappa-B-binding protein [Hyla sarda]
MDSLDTMLSDPLDLGPCLTSNGTGIMEPCLLGGTRVSLPEDLLEDPELFFDVVSMDTWKNVLSDSQREHLSQFLPSFPENNSEQQEQVVRSLFRGENFRFGNPLHTAQKLFRDGHLNPEVVKYRQLCLKSQYKRYLTSQQQYFHNLLKQILASRQELLDVARKKGPDLVLKRKLASLRNSPEERERRAQRRYLKILREVKEECGDATLSSEEEDLSSWLPGSPTQLPGAAVPLRSVQTLSTQDMKTADKVELTERDLKLLLRKHREKRKHQPDHPDLMTDDVTMNDIMTRVNAGRKNSLAALFDLATMKRRVKERDERKKKKMKPIKTEPDDYPEVPEETDMMPALMPSDQSVPTPLTVVKEEPMDDVKPPLMFNEISASFFTLLLDILMVEGPSSLMLLEDKVSHWQSSPASTLNSWFSAVPNWCDLVHSALLYLSGDSKGTLSGFTPYVEFKEKTQQWRCLGPPSDLEKELVALFHLWLETKDHILSKEIEESVDTGTPVPRVRTDYIVRPSSGDEKRIFQEQERHRYLQPHKAFTFRMHGFDSVVGPVKGVFDKETSLNKAREHSLLRSDRPAYVTILSLVRDAAARLPNGEGTRAEICELLKDSQFLAPDVTSAQVNTVVSGALDRLHYEKDPCVKYDIGRKLWIYLHRDRSEEEFERIHQAQAAAAKAKKALQQKPKTPSKIKSSSKEFSVKSGGTPEPGPLTLSECSMPPTPGTPSTPTTPALPTTPLSPSTSAAVSKIVASSVPEPPKSSPSVLLVSSPTIPQLSTLLTPPVTSQVTTVTPGPVRTPLSTAPAIPQVRIVTTPAPVTPAPPPAIVSQPLSPVVSHIRLPVTSSTTKGLTQVVTMPVKTSAAAPRLGTSLTNHAGITVTTFSSSTVVASKPVVSSPAGSAPAILQSITGQSILKQVALSGQLGMKSQSASSLPLSTTNLRIQGKDVLRLPPSSITTDAKGQTILRITPDMMATLAKSQVTAVKLSQELFSANPATSSSKGLLQMTSNPSSPSPPAPATIKVTPEVKPVEASSSGFRLMPALGVSVADQKSKTTTSADTKPATTIRIVQGLGVIPPKAAATQSITVTAKPVPVVSSAVVSPVHTATTVSLTPAASKPTGVTVGTAAATVRQIPVTTTQQGKLPARITVPLSVLSQPMKGKSVVAAPIIKGNLGANISGLGRNIILTTVPAGTKLIAGNKPVSFLTTQQLQQLQQQGQATQVRIQTVPASHLQPASSAASKAVSTVVVTTTPPPKPATEPQ